MAKSATLALVGDILPTSSPAPFDRLGDALSTADIGFANLECPLSRRGTPAKAKLGRRGPLDNEYLFRDSPETAHEIAAAGIDIVSLANNHSMDYGPVALADTIASLSAQGVSTVGASALPRSGPSSTTITRGGLRVTFLAYVTGDALPASHDFARTSSAPGVELALLNPKAASTQSDAVDRDITAARPKSDLLVVSFHWGTERSEQPTASQAQLAHHAIDLGADVVVGHHPHCLQGVEVYRGKPILYSLGNFVFPGGDFIVRRTAIAKVTFGPEGPRRVDLVSAFINNGRPVLLESVPSLVMAEHILDLSARVGTSGALSTIGSAVAARFLLKGAQTADAQSTDLVPLRYMQPKVVLDIRYATARNRFGRPMYLSSAAYLRRGTAAKLTRAAGAAADSGLKLKIWDAYRPLSVQRLMWSLFPDPSFVADPGVGSDHNRAAAVDVTLTDKADRELDMPTPFDAFGPMASHDASGVTPSQRQNRALLKALMVNAGFRPLQAEWWHYSDQAAGSYDLLDLPVGRLPLADDQP